MSKFQCSDRIAQIQYALQNLPEYNNIYTIDSINTTTPVVDSGSNNSGSAPMCDIEYTYSSATTGYPQKDTRRIVFRQDPDSDDYIVAAVSAINPAKKTRIPQEEVAVLEYYKSLRAYNTNWIQYGWKQAGASYNPPRPKWDDPIFDTNIEIYKANFDATRAYMASQTDKSVLQDLFTRRIAPVPADPIPPVEYDVTVQYATEPTPEEIQQKKAQDAAEIIRKTITDAQNTYNDWLPPGSRNYDPPVPGDTYETVLIKLNKAFDESSAAQSASLNAISGYSGSFPSTADRRLIGRVGRTFPVPAPIPPKTGINTTATHFAPYKFNERQQYLINYTPVRGADVDLLKANFCKSLGYLPADSTKAECAGGDCCAPLPAAPSYTGSLEEGFRSGSGQCIPSPFGGATARRTITVSVPSQPINVETSNRLYTYRMSKPIANCKPPTAADPIIVGELYDAVRPAFMQEIKKSLEGDKMFSLRCPGSCFNN